MDPDLYNKCEEEYEQSCLEAQHHSQERQQRWEILQKAAQAAITHANSDPTAPQQQESMQIDTHTPVNVPEQIPEEPHDTPDMSMADVASPA
jgi:hypothetical protein